MFLELILPVVALLSLWQAPTDPEADPRDSELRTLERPEAVELAATHKAALRDKDPKVRLAALNQLAQGRHEEISKLLKDATNDKDLGIRVRVVQLLGTQRDDIARKALTQLARPGRGFKPFVGVEAARSLGYTGYGKSGFQQLEQLFWKHPSKELRKAVIQTFGRQKEKQAVSLLISVIDQPGLKDPDNPERPPASYWKEKHEEWIHFKDDAISALAEITGKKFYNSETALDWIDTEGKRLGFRFQRQPDPW